MPKFTRNDAQAILDSILAKKETLDAVELSLDSVNDLTDKFTAVAGTAENAIGMEQVYSAILDGVLDYQKQHGSMPDASVIATALNQAYAILDDVASVTGDSHHHSSTAFTPMQPIVAIRSMIATTIPFAHYISAENQSGEGSIVIVSHKTSTKTGQYDEGDSLNGMAGGFTYISPERTHKLESSDRITYNGKVTAEQTSFDQCNQSGKVIPLYPNNTQIYVNGLLEMTSSGSGDQETASTIITLDKQYTLNAKVNIKTGAMEVKADQALPENTDITVVAYLNVESQDFKDITPSVKVEGKKYPFKARFYRAKVLVTPEAAEQFRTEVGIDPAFEGTFAIRNQFAQETLFSLLHNLSKIGARVNATQYDFNWATQGNEKTQATIAEDLIGKIEAASKEMAKKNGSHGVSHIYIGERLASVLSSLGERYFESSGITARGSVYRLGRLKGVNAEIYYTPKGIVGGDGSPAKSERMLLIGASANSPAFNPVIIGEAAAPAIEAINPTSKDPEKGYWVTGRRIVVQNPVKDYAASVAVIDCINMAY